MDIDSFLTQILYYFETELLFLFIENFWRLYEYIKFFNFGHKNADSYKRDAWHRWCSCRPFHTYAYCSVSVSDLLFICAAPAS